LAGRGGLADVPLVLADQQMSGMGGTQLLARVRQSFPTARHGFLISWGEPVDACAGDANDLEKRRPAS
jgi:hypothetical protein